MFARRNTTGEREARRGVSELMVNLFPLVTLLAMVVHWP